MIDVKTATRNAIQFVADLFEGDASVIRSMRIEEVMPSDDGYNWLITLSFLPSNVQFESRDSREYKVLELDGKTGEVQSMRIREVSV